MTRYIQFHILISHAPSNLNRDDTGRPKTAILGGLPRLRISSQSLKRTWRNSESFRTALEGHTGVRTKRIVEEIVLPKLEQAGVSEKDRLKWAQEIAGTLGEVDGKTARTKQLVHISPGERAALETLADKMASEKRAATEDERALLKYDGAAVDIALFGRMIAADPEHNVDAAAQVAHALTVHPVTVEEDYFTAVDDLKTREEDMGAGHVGVNEFGAGVFYEYVCVNRDLLVANLSYNEDLAARALAALARAMTTTNPSGKQNSFASHAYASYVRVESGTQQPRSLAAAFLNGVHPPYLRNAIDNLEAYSARLDSAYGRCWDTSAALDVEKGEGSLEKILAFVQA